MIILNKIYEHIKQFIKEEYKFLLIIVFLFLLFTVELPYVIYTPGGAINLEKRISIEDGYSSKGKLQMAYVTMVKGSVPYILLSKVLPNWDLEKKEAIKYEDETMKDMLFRDKIYLQEAVDNATLVAYENANKTPVITKSINHVVYISAEADTTLKIRDIILSVNEEDISSLEEYKEIIARGSAGDILSLKVLRNNKEKECTIKIYETEAGLKTGLQIITTYEYTTEPKLDIKSKSSESGPSGGLLMALSIYDALTEEDLTRGKNIIGTGTIDREGNVGAIGGVKYKLIGAVKKKADIFICPVENYEEAMKIKNEHNYKIKIIKVSSFQEAIQELLKG